MFLLAVRSNCHVKPTNISARDPQECGTDLNGMRQLLLNLIARPRQPDLCRPDGPAFRWTALPARHGLNVTLNDAQQ